MQSQLSMVGKRFKLKIGQRYLFLKEGESVAIECISVGEFNDFKLVYENLPFLGYSWSEHYINQLIDQDLLIPFPDGIERAIKRLK